MTECATIRCKHCGKKIASENVEFCCSGCEAAYAASHTPDAGFGQCPTDTAKAAKAEATAREEARFSPFSAPNAEQPNQWSITALVDGIHCASCVWNIESALGKDARILYARVNLSTKRLIVEWEGEAGDIDAILAPIEAMGYPCKPMDETSVTSEADQQSRSLLLCMAVSGFAMGNVMLMSVAVWSDTAEMMGMATRDLLHWISALIAVPALAFSARPFFRSAFKALKSGHTNMDVPISIAIILATGMSVLETMNHGEYVYFDSAIMLTFFLLIGRYLDMRARGKALSSAQDLLSMMTGSATVLIDGAPTSVPIRELEADMVVLVATGEKIPADSIILSGTSDLDTSLVTGETVPRTVSAGADVYAGTLNLSAPLKLRVSRASEDSLLCEIVRLMEGAEQGQARYVRLADRAAKLYTPVVHTFGLATFLGWWLLMHAPWQTSLLHGITVLIITCPCALGLAVPVVQVLASSLLMRKGILLKSGDALERLTAIDTVVFDKTGTLTMGTPALVSGAENAEMLHLAAALAQHSKHPLSKALMEQAGTDYPALDGEVREIAGHGLEVMHQEQQLRLGKRVWACGAEDKTASLPESGLTDSKAIQQKAEDSPRIRDADSGSDESLEQEICLSIDGKLAAEFRFADTLRSDSAKVVQTLQSAGLDVLLLSGDRAPIVEHMAQTLGITTMHAEVTPVQKCEVIQALQAKGHKVLMVGDGLNDAPSLAAADISVSPASGMDITQNTADIVFQGKQLGAIVQAWKVARHSTTLVKQNFALAVVYNIIAIPIAVLGYVTPLVAAIAMSGSSILVIANAFRLMANKEHQPKSL